MSFCQVTRCPFFSGRWTGWIIGFGIIAFVLTAAANAQIEGFTEPFRTIELSSDETGAIAKLNVEEGQAIEAGMVIARLDTRLQELQAEIAKHLSESTSQVVAAELTYRKRFTIHQRVQGLRESGNATEGELIRSEMELSIAKARYLAAKEEATVRQIEHERAIVQLDRRTIRAPFAGVVSKIHRYEGEFLSPLHPEILTLVRVDRILATFNVPSSQIRVFEPGKEFNLELNNGSSVVATVYSIGIETDAQSGTVKVKLVIENPASDIRSGEICTLNI